jgi:hypothetical protein
MQYPSKLYTFNENKNPHSYYLLWKISWHKNINFNRSQGDIISVKRLMDVCPMLPVYNNIAETGQIRQRIIEPFTRDMNAFSDVLSWQYYRKKTPLSEEEVKQLDYASFSKLMIHVKWHNFPIEKNENQKKV